MPNYKLALAIAATLAAIGSAWYFASVPPPKPAGPPRFLHCPDCDFERPYAARDEGKTCPSCTTGKLAPATESVRTVSDAPKPFHRNPLALALTSATAILAVTYLYVTLKSRKTVVTEEVVYSYCRCTKCKRRIKYASKRESRAIICPTCRTELLPPVTAPDS